MPAIVYHPLVIRRFYVHNFRCLENFELRLAGHPSVLLIGKNGCGKSTVGFALRVLQRIARRTNQVAKLVKPKDFFLGHADAPMRFEIEVELESRVYGYLIAFDLPEGFKELRVREEKLTVDGTSVFARELAEVHLAKRTQSDGGQVRIEWDLAALPIIQRQSKRDPLFIFRQWLARALILRPVPSLIRGDSEQETLLPIPDGTNLGAWFSGLLASTPSAYTKVDEYLRQVMPDLKDIKNPQVGADARRLEVQFSNEQGAVDLAFADLSDGEKCFMICAVVIAANEAYGPLLCFWDEPDSHLNPSEVGHLVMALRTAFRSRGQLMATSHNPEAIRRFSDENTFHLRRENHLEPTVVRPVNELQVSGDLVDALIRGDVD